MSMSDTRTVLSGSINKVIAASGIIIILLKKLVDNGS